MATINRERMRLATYNEDQNATLQEVDTSGTAFEMNDLVTRGSTSGIDKATGGASDTDLAIAAEPAEASDPYYEPIPSGVGAFGQETQRNVFLLHGQDVEANVSGTISQSNIGNIYALAYDSTNNVPVVDLSSSSTSGVKILRLADEVHGGVLGDTDARVIGRFTDDLVL